MSANPQAFTDEIINSRLKVITPQAQSFLAQLDSRDFTERHRYLLQELFNAVLSLRSYRQRMLGQSGSDESLFLQSPVSQSPLLTHGDLFWYSLVFITLKEPRVNALIRSRYEKYFIHAGLNDFAEGFAYTLQSRNNQNFVVSAPLFEELAVLLRQPESELNSVEQLLLQFVRFSLESNQWQEYAFILPNSSLEESQAIAKECFALLNSKPVPIGPSVTKNSKSDKQNTDTAAEKTDETTANEPTESVVTNTTHDILATRRICSDHYASKDLLGYEMYAQLLKEFMLHKDTPYPFAIGIQAPWGQGKTTLMRMLQHKLDPQHPDIVKAFNVNAEGESSLEDNKLSLGKSSLSIKQLKAIFTADVCRPNMPHEANMLAPTVWFNAWKYQTSEEIWAGLAHAITSQLTERLDPIEYQKFWIGRNLKKYAKTRFQQTLQKHFLDSFLPWLLGSMSLVFAGALYSEGYLTGVGVLAGFFSGGWEKYKQNQLKISEFFPELLESPNYSEQLGHMHHTEADIRLVTDLLSSRNRPIVVFVDDLDRCSPRQIAKTVEAMNLFLSGEYPNTVFVLGMDPYIVASALEAENKSLIDRMIEKEHYSGWKFMDKFIQLPFVIPVNRQLGGLTFLNNQLDSTQLSAEEVQAQNDYGEELKDKIQALKNVTSAEELLQQAKRLAELKTEKQPTSEQQREIRNEANRVYVEKAQQFFSDSSAAIVKIFQPYGDFLTQNPRCIKRIINLFRFHISCLVSRQIQGLACASENDIALMSILIVRWPRVFRACISFLRDAENAQEMLTHTQLINKFKRMNEASNLVWNEEQLKFLGHFNNLPTMSDKGFW